MDDALEHVHLIDFGIATRLSQENQKAISPDALEGTLAYMSPEQTGRMSRVIDIRTDIYSFGVTLYEMLTGTLPFSAIEPSDLVHSHIARQPQPPHERNLEIPLPISQIVSKMLAKSAEDRYQTGYGLQADLAHCLQELHEYGQVELFPLGRHDQSNELRIPQKLYGRQEELHELLAAFERVHRGNAELLLVAGYSGIGKSALVQEMHSTVAKKHGYYITGKFEQLNRGVPYTGIAQACQELIRQILTEKPDRLAQWRNLLSEALGINSGAIAALIPELTLVIGPSPSLPVVGPTESQNRFSLAFQKFLRVFTKAEHPLLIFLDDLQWADAATLKLLQEILTDPECSHLLLIGAYRDNEVDAGHPLSLTLENLGQSTATVHRIFVQALEPPSIVRLIAETLGQDSQKVAPLADIVYQKTRGNPFFINQFLVSLHKAGLLFFDTGAGIWNWHAEQIQTCMVTDNVVDFMVAKLRLFNSKTQHVLQLAACIGHQFDLRTLSVIAERTPIETAEELWPALQEGLVLPLDAEYRFIDAKNQQFGVDTDELVAKVSYRFQHDRVQQAAYLLTSESARQQLHLRIGRLMLLDHDNLDDEPSDGSIFEITQHLNSAKAFISDVLERDRLARLNLTAALKAKAATAYAAAVDYLQMGMSLLSEKAWESDYALCFAFYTERAECECMIGQFERAGQFFAELLPRLKTNRERVHVCNLRVILNTTIGNFSEALQIGKSGLALYGIELPESPELVQLAFQNEFEAVQSNLAGRRIEDLLHLPELTDPDKALTLQLLTNLNSSAYFVNPMLYGVIILQEMNLSLKYGHTDISSYCYVAYGFMLAGLLGHYAEAYAFGRLGLDLNEKFHNKALTSKLNSSFGGYLHFCQPMRTVLRYFERAYREGIENGDFVFVSYASFASLLAHFSMGDELEAVRQESERAYALVQRTKDVISTAHVLLARQAIANLQGRTKGLDSLSTSDFDEYQALDGLLKGNLIPPLCVYYVVKLSIHYLYEDYAAALADAEAAETWSAGTLKTAFLTDLPFWHSLTLLACYPSVSAEEQVQSLEKVRRNRAEIEKWAKGCLENFEVRLMLIDAELKRIRSEDHAAELAYDKALILAQQQKDLQREALANELCAKFYLSRGRKKLAMVYMTDAHYGYVHWGATAKAADLLAKHPTLILQNAGDATPASSLQTALSPVVTSTHLHNKGVLDVTAVLHAAQAIASEIVLDRVLEQVMRIVVQNAGARRGALLLQQETELHIEAVLTIDPDTVHLRLNEPVDGSSKIPASVVNYVAHTRETVVLGDARREGRFASDPYIAIQHPKSALCLALVHQGLLIGVLYLENDVAADAFTAERVELLRLLSTQAANAVQNALLYEHVKAVTSELENSNQELRLANERLQIELQERVAAEQKQLALQNEIINFQSARLAEMSTPLIPITSQIMIMPLIGVMDSQRAQHVLETALQGVQTHRTQVVIIDITGMKHVDTSVASTLINAARALRLLGAQAVLTGIRAEVAQTLVGLGINLSTLVTLGTLQSGIAYALGRTGESRLLAQSATSSPLSRVNL